MIDLTSVCRGRQVHNFCVVTSICGSCRWPIFNSVPVHLFTRGTSVGALSIVAWHARDDVPFHFSGVTSSGIAAVELLSWEVKFCFCGHCHRPWPPHPVIPGLSLVSLLGRRVLKAFPSVLRPCASTIVPKGKGSTSAINRRAKIKKGAALLWDMVRRGCLDRSFSFEPQLLHRWGRS